jgi:hypothetical protein
LREEKTLTGKNNRAIAGDVHNPLRKALTKTPSRAQALAAGTVCDFSQNAEDLKNMLKNIIFGLAQPGWVLSR